MYQQIAKNERRSIFIIVVFVLMVGLIGAGFAYAMDDMWITVWVLVAGICYAVMQYWFANAILMTTTGAKPIEKKDNPRLYNIVENLSITAGLPMPKVCVIQDSAPNAFASGRDPEHAMVAATTGLLDIMDDKELTAVMAHEMSHVKNYDIRISMLVFGLTVVVGVIADLGVRLFFRRGENEEGRSPVGVVIMILIATLAPLVSLIARMAVSRQREFLADVSAAHLTRYPEGMIAALKKLGAHERPMRRQNSAAEAMFIASPMKKNFFSNMFSTHPTIEARVAALEKTKFNF